MSRIQKLSQCLVDKYGLSEQESEGFVTNLFGIIREKLLVDRIVKVKGLGTFKLTEMNARESVSVNTGERITIEGRYKLSFTPENTVRDRINSPFASFESIDMDSDIDFSEIDRKYEASEAAAKEVQPSSEAVSLSIEETSSSGEDEPSLSEVSLPSGERESLSPSELPTEPVAEESPAVVPVDEVPLQSGEVESGHSETSSTLCEGEANPPSVSQAEHPEECQEKTNVRAPICEELIKENINHNQTIINLLHWLIGLVILVLLSFGGYFIYNIGYDKGSTHHNEVENHVAHQTKPKAKPVAPKAEAKPSKPASHSESFEKPSPSSSDEKSLPSASNEKSSLSGKGEFNSPSHSQSASSAVAESYNNKDARVRTGAYNIVGTQATVTVKAGQTLKSISKFYLGDGMECYIEVYNDGKTSFQAGDKVKIPKLKLKKKKK